MIWGFGDENRSLKKTYAEERLKAEIVAEPLTKKMVFGSTQFGTADLGNS